MGEKNGALFNIIVVVVLTGIIIGLFVIFVPKIIKLIQTNAESTVNDGFKVSKDGLGSFNAKDTPE